MRRLRRAEAREMQVITTLYGQALMLGLIACGLAWILSPNVGQQIAKRCAASVFFFLVGTVALTMAGGNFFQSVIRTLLASAALLAAFVWLVHSANAARLLRLIGALGFGLFLLVFSLHGILHFVGR